MSFWSSLSFNISRISLEQAVFKFRKNCTKNTKNLLRQDPIFQDRICTKYSHPCLRSVQLTVLKLDSLLSSKKFILQKKNIFSFECLFPDQLHNYQLMNVNVEYFKANMTPACKTLTSKQLIDCDSIKLHNAISPLNCDFGMWFHQQMQ